MCIVLLKNTVLLILTVGAFIDVEVCIILQVLPSTYVTTVSAIISALLFIPFDTFFSTQKITGRI